MPFLFNQFVSVNKKVVKTYLSEILFENKTSPLGHFMYNGHAGKAFKTEIQIGAWGLIKNIIYEIYHKVNNKVLKTSKI